MRRQRLTVIGIAMAAMAMLLVTGWQTVRRDLQRPHRGWSGATIDVEIEPGTPARTVIDHLAAAGVLAHPRLTRAWIVWSGNAHRLRAGEYRFERPASAFEVIDRLRQGDVLLHAITLPEGLTLRQVAARYAELGFGDEGQLRAAFSEAAAIRDLDPRAEDLEGYLFPDTYRFQRGTAPERIAAVMIQRFREVIEPDYVARAASFGFDLRAAVTLASMIERETSLAEERPRISRVFHNRLRRGMRMECDPTVVYALERMGATVPTLTRQHLKVASPWNTYRVHGLPPGPIANPGRHSLLAAIEPSGGNEIFFVAAPGGGHRFSEHLSAHLRAAAEWRRHVRSSR